MFSHRHNEQLIESAIKFLTKNIDLYSTNPKPVIFHSLRVAETLSELGYSNEIVIGAILHDIHEDAYVSFDEIEKNFGKQVANFVSNTSFNETITDKTEQYVDLFTRCLRGGKECLLIKAADIYDNSFYYNKSGVSFPYVCEKMEYFIKISEELLSQEPIYALLTKQYKSIIS